MQLRAFACLIPFAYTFANWILVLDTTYCAYILPLLPWPICKHFPAQTVTQEIVWDSCQDPEHPVSASSFTSQRQYQRKYFQTATDVIFLFFARNSLQDFYNKFQLQKKANYYISNSFTSLWFSSNSKKNLWRVFWYLLDRKVIKKTF